MPSYQSVQRVGKVLRFLAVTLIYAVCLLLFLRMCSANAPRKLRGLDANDVLKAAYAESNTLTLCYQNGDSITRAEPSKGYFAIPEYVYIPEANQVQLIFRYNNSTLAHLQEDYELAEAPTREGDWYDLTLVVKQRVDGNEQETRIHATKIEKSLDKRLYTFYRMTFDGVAIDENTIGLFADIYYKDDIHYDESPYGTLCLYDPAEAWLTKKLSSGERRALTE